jgi:hypothetical protein
MGLLAQTEQFEGRIKKQGSTPRLKTKRYRTEPSEFGSVIDVLSDLFRNRARILCCEFGDCDSQKFSFNLPIHSRHCRFLPCMSLQDLQIRN